MKDHSRRAACRSIRSVVNLNRRCRQPIRAAGQVTVWARRLNGRRQVTISGHETVAADHLEWRDSVSFAGSLFAERGSR